jgi:hypothetical protein
VLGLATLGGVETTANGEAAQTGGPLLKLLAVVLIIYGALRLILLAVLILQIGVALHWYFTNLRPDVATFVRGVLMALALGMAPIALGVAILRRRAWIASVGPLVCLFVLLYELCFVQFDGYGWFDTNWIHVSAFYMFVRWQPFVAFVLLSIAAILMRSTGQTDQRQVLTWRFLRRADVLLVAIGIGAAGWLVPLGIGAWARVVASVVALAITAILMRRVATKGAERQPTRPGYFSRSAGLLLAVFTAALFIPLWAAPVMGFGALLRAPFGPDLGETLLYLPSLAVRIGADIAVLVVGLGLARRWSGAYLPGLFIVGLAAWMHAGALSPTRLSTPGGIVHASYAVALMAILGLLLVSAPKVVAIRRSAGRADGQDAQHVTSAIPDDEGWRLALLASLHETGVTSPRDNPGRPIALTVLLISIGVVSQFFGNVFVPPMIAKATLVTRSLVSILWTCGWFFIISPLFGQGKRMMTAMRAKSAVEELSRPQARRPILYLRSFDIDQDAGRPAVADLFGHLIQAPTPEQTLARVLSRAGPVLAIGRPGEQLPRLGAARFYVTDDLWKQKVADIAKAAQLVVWTSGVSDGLRWEISYLLKAVPLRKLVLWAHPHLIEGAGPRREEEWKLFCSSVGQAFPRPLPQTLGETEFFIFADDGSPISIEPKLGRWRRLTRRFLGARDPSLRAILAAKRMV